jgi:hypothetical protein
MLWPNKIFMSWRSITFLSTGKRGSLLNRLAFDSLAERQLAADEAKKNEQVV